MTGVRVDRSVARSTPTPLPAIRAVLVALAVALSLGAVACAARLGAGHAHGPVAVAADAVVEGGISSPSHHPLHIRPDVPPGAAALGATAPDGDPDPHAGGTSSGDAHPGMACIVSVDLHVPEPTAELVGVRCETADAVVGSEWADDLDPPVPRLS